MTAVSRLIHGCDNTNDQTAALAAFGLKPEQPLPSNTCGLWPENVPAVTVFASAMTQWHFTQVGPTGLRYESLPLLLEAAQVPRADWPLVLQDIRVMEAHALELLAQRRR